MRRRVAGLVVIDEVHIHVQHGTSFCEEICELRDVFFDPSSRLPEIFLPCCSLQRPLTCQPTTQTIYTTSSPYLFRLAQSFKVQGSPSSFRQCELKFEYSIVNTSDYAKTGLSLAIKTMKASQGCIVIFVNTWTRAMHLTSQLEKKCNESELAVDILSLNSSLYKHNKFWRIQFFVTRAHRLANSNSTALSPPTARISASIITRYMTYSVFIFLTICRLFSGEQTGSHERGRRSTTHLFVDLASYINLKRQINGADLSEDDDLRAEDTEDLALVRHNSALTPLKEKAKKIVECAKKGK